MHAMIIREKRDLSELLFASHVGKLQGEIASLCCTQAIVILTIVPKKEEMMKGL